MPRTRAGLITGVDARSRCWWCEGDEQYREYHDQEWGAPVTDDNRLFEKICLEGFQAGLSWLTILRKRDDFRRAFADFEIDRVARFNKASVERLLRDASIVRHRGKIESAVNNARRARELQGEFGSLSAYFWGYEPAPRGRERPRRVTRAAIKRMPSTPTSTAIAKDLKRRGWSFVGPTTVYAFMQAMGMVNDHVEGCWRREPVERARARRRA